MSFCQKCGFELQQDSLFCGKCGTAVTAAPEKAVCVKCGTELNDDILYCHKCGTRKSASPGYTRQPTYTPPQTVRAPEQPSYIPYQPQSQTDTYNGTPGHIEQELYRRMVSHSTTLTQTSGTLTITNKKINYKPMAMYLFSKEITINMNEVSKVQKGSIAGWGVDIFTKQGKKYYFSIGIDGSEVQRVMDIINRNKR